MKKFPGRIAGIRAGVSCIPMLWLGFASAAQATAAPTSDATHAENGAPIATTQPDSGAQPAGNAAPAADAGTQPGDGDIVVTARRRTESLLQVPLSVTALGPQQLQEQNLVSVTDLNRAAPNVILRQTNSGGGTVDAVIRGQSYAISNIANDPPVGLYFDDVIVTQNKGAAVGIFDVQSVEVSRGVQGTLRGRNNTGGAINITTRRPQLDSFNGEVSATYGSRNYVQMQGILNVPVGDTLAIRLGAQRITQDGYGHSLESGQELGGRNQWIARGSLLFQPTSRLSLFATYEHIEINQEPIGRRMIPGSLNYIALINGTRSAVNTSGIQRTPDQLIPANFWDASTNYIMPNDRANVDFVRGTLQYEFSRAATFKVIAGYRALNASGGIDLEGGPGLVLESVNGGTSHQFTIEPQLSGELGHGLISYVLGYYHFSDSGMLVADTYSYAVNNAAPSNPFRNYLIIREGAHNISDAGYGHIEFHPTSRLELAAGLRYTSDIRIVRPNRVNDYADPRSSLNALYLNGTLQPVGCLFTTPVNGVLRPAGGFVTLNGSVIASGACPSIELRKDYGFTSYDVSARYEITPQLSIYARHALGQKSGGINVPINSTISPPFDPEVVRDYEIGLRGSRLGGVFSFSLAAYYSDYKGLQRYVSSLVPGVGVSSTVINAGSATIKGIEGEFDLRLRSGFSLNGFFGFTDAKYDRFTTTDPNGVVVDLSNQPFFATPKFTSRLGASYEFGFAGGTLHLGSGWVHQSNSSLQAISFPGAYSGDVDLVDARISWESPDRRFELAAYATNLLNDKYFTSASVNRTGVSTAVSSGAGAYATPGDPRFFGLSATFRFGNR